MSGLDPNVLRAIAALCAAVAVVLNGHYDATSIGEAVLAVVGLLTLVQAQLNAHAAKAPIDAHPATGELAKP